MTLAWYRSPRVGMPVTKALQLAGILVVLPWRCPWHDGVAVAWACSRADGLGVSALRRSRVDDAAKVMLLRQRRKGVL